MPFGFSAGWLEPKIRRVPEIPLVETVQVADCQLTVARFGSGPIKIVLIHDGLGSIAQWRDVPSQLGEATDVGVLAYDRAGHGNSEPTKEAGPTWLHQEALVLAELLDHYQVENPLIVGHSDGGSIGLIYAASQQSCSATSQQSCSGVITLAAHSFVEDVCVAKISEMRSNPGLIVIGLARHHKSPQALFDSWSGVWTSSEFRSWDIRADIGAITCPVLVVQGQVDAYATDAQLTETASAIGDNATAMRVAGVGHVLHHEVPDQVVEIVSNFFRSLN